jgi:tripartite-type tricarboxylate transporter receptor subunit TctC
VIAPAGLPRPIVDILNAAGSRAIQSPAFATWNATTGNEPGGGTPDEFAALIASDSKKWAR